MRTKRAKQQSFNMDEKLAKELDEFAIKHNKTKRSIFEKSVRMYLDAGGEEKKKYNACYLIDLENVHDSWVDVEFEIKSYILLFDTASTHVKDNDLTRVRSAGHKVLFANNITTGKPNECDFQICVWLGKAIMEIDAKKYVIVSSDSGFNAAVSMLASYGYSVSRMNRPDNVKYGCSIDECLRMARSDWRYYSTNVQKFRDLLCHNGYAAEEDAIVKELKKSGKLRKKLGGKL